MDKTAMFPEFFYSKEPITSKVQPIDYGDGYLRWFNVIEAAKQTNFNETKPNNSNKYKPYDDNDSGLIDCCDIEATYEIIPTRSGKSMTSFYVPSALHSVIVGAKGWQLRQLQESTGTLIKVPKPNEQGEVKITGNNERSVAAARTQIAMIVLNKREKMAVTHFVSIPIVSETIKNNFRIFKEEILRGPPTRGIDDTIFQKPEKFHLTITTLTLLDETEIEDAKKHLNECYKTVIEPFFPKNKKVKIVLKGVEIMNDDPSDVDVLYGTIKLEDPRDNKIFQEMADEIVNFFYIKGLVRKQYENVKLHVTLMNSLFRKNDDYEKDDAKNNKRESFDATYVMEKYSSYYFGPCNFDNVQLSIRFSKNSSGYYESALTLPIVI